MFSSAGQPHPYHTTTATHAFRHLSLSPPDAELDSSHAIPVADLDMAQGAGHYLGAMSERTRFQTRRTSALSYQNSGARDPRDRSASRHPKNLVVVVPPSDFPLDQRQLGHVLSMGPRHRLSQGILMPLFSSMFGQLNAIAREYNFPSTAGLCLYLHTNENGMMMTPRISDDSWQYLFGHLFETHQSFGGQQLPIGGCVEFDIDLNKARWFDAWVSGVRDPEPALPPVVTSQAPLAFHRRKESENSNLGGQPIEDRWESGSQTLFTHSRPETIRHVPRKLSLVDRLEVHLPKSQNHPDHSGSLPKLETHELSPIPQSANPPAKSDLEHRVNSWRATTESQPVSMTEAHRPTPDVGLPIGATTDEHALEHHSPREVSVEEVDINEFQWSVSSMGPSSPIMDSPVPSSVPFSIHLDCRANGSVPATPTTATSWGPADDDWCSDISSVSRLPSPDLGERAVEDIMAPRRSGVWGNSFGWRSAMTWKAVYPYSAPLTKPPIRVQLQDSSVLVSHYPNLVIYPTVASHLDMDTLPNFPKHTESSRLGWGDSFGWKKGITWRKAYPYSTATMRLATSVQLRGAGGLVPQYPNFCIYPAVYPYSEVYPACTVDGDTSQLVTVVLGGPSDVMMSYPNLVIYPSVYPHLDVYPPVMQGAEMKALAQMNTDVYSPDCIYPHFVIYSTVYPYFDLYPTALQITEIAKQREVNIRLESCLAAEYPNITIYPNAYPYLEIYPRCNMSLRTSSLSWGISFGWSAAKTWHQVCPLHTPNPPTRRGHQGRSISKSWCQSPVISDIVTGKQAVWGRSFGWKSATTWRAVWPTSHTETPRNPGPTSVYPGKQGCSPLNYPSLIIYPAVYPHFDIYPPAVTVEESQVTKKIITTTLIVHYPNLAIYPVAYPHFDLYPVMTGTSDIVDRAKGSSNLRRRRIEMWRAKTAAQFGLLELLANNHIWEVEEPLRLDLAEYAWSQTSAGPTTSPLELPHTQSALVSVHMDHRVQGSVALTPSTATTWGPQDDDWYSDISSIDRLPSPDLGLRVLDDVENPRFPYQPWHMVWPYFGNTGQMKALSSAPSQSAPVSEYPRLVIYPPVYPHFELYPTWHDVSTVGDQVTEAFASTYPIFDIYPTVYPHFNIYPVHLQIETLSEVVSNVHHEPVEVKLPSLYPNLDVYHARYPWNLDYIYPSANAMGTTQPPVEAPPDYPWLVIYPSVYPYIIPYPNSSTTICQPMKPEPSFMLSSAERRSLSVKLPARYPILELYPAGYPWSIESIYPVTSVDDFPEIPRPYYPHIPIYPAVYPFVHPYPTDSVHIPGALDEGDYEFAKAYLALSELRCMSAKYPHFDLYPASLTLAPQQGHAVQSATLPPRIIRRKRKTHMELHTAVFRLLKKRPAQHLKTHQQLHNEVFQDGIAWTPSGYMREPDLSSVISRKPGNMPVLESQHRPPQAQDNATARPSRLTAQSPDRTIFTFGQPPALSPASPSRVRSPGFPSQPPPAVSESPVPRISSPPSIYAHRRAPSSRLAQAVQSMMAGAQRRDSGSAPGSPPPEDQKERVKDYQQPSARFLSLADRRPTTAPLSHGNVSEFNPVRTSQSLQRKGSLVLQRARAYEQATGTLR